MEQQQQPQNRVVFDNTADQYVKGEDVTAFFTIQDGIEDVSNEDQIGLLRVRSTFLKFIFLYIYVLIGGLYKYQKMYRIYTG